MSETLILDIGREAVMVSFLVIAPVLGITLVIGLIISLFQALTQIQDMTLTFVPKLIAVGILMLYLGGWMLTIMLEYTQRIFLNLALFTH